MSSDSSNTDWAAWSHDAVTLLQGQNDSWMEQFGLISAPYRWDLATAELVFERDTDTVCASICVVGSVSVYERTFLWSWANETIPAAAKAGIDTVRQFGQDHGLALLVTPSFPGGRPEGLEMLAVASRILAAEGAWVAPAEDVTLFFALLGFRVAPRRKKPWWRSGTA